MWYDICRICKDYFHESDDATKGLLRDVFSYKGADYFKYLIQTKKDSVIDVEKLAKNFYEILDWSGIKYERAAGKLFSKKVLVHRSSILSNFRWTRFLFCKQI